MVEEPKKLETGQLIWRQMIKTPMFNHYGVFVRYNGEELVIHKNSTRKERITTLNEFLKGYKLRGVKNTPMVGQSGAQIILKVEEMTDREFNLFYDNCEEFAHEVAGVPYRGRELDRGVLITVAVLVFALLASE
jgi:hypothetical protein